ncbi:hypothetical protein DERF_012507 [Dermatophagoides farinae]|uniref:Uncharacterized protein n=1 Tax=Dermatophagoides farinae TaxID=6954 RepID=A0A922L3I2_DERFA|nr:hypothetical protein DERF_012507 [Dermatophagoides farinae]
MTRSGNGEKFSHLNHNLFQQQQQQKQPLLNDKHIEQFNQFDDDDQTFSTHLSIILNDNNHDQVNQIDFPPQSSSSLSLPSSNLTGKNLSKKSIFCCHLPSSSSTLTTTTSPSSSSSSSFKIVNDNKVNDVNKYHCCHIGKKCANIKCCCHNVNNDNSSSSNNNNNNNDFDDDNHINHNVNDHHQQQQKVQQQKRSNILIQNDDNIFDHHILNIHSDDDDHHHRNRKKFVTRTNNNHNRKSDSNHHDIAHNHNDDDQCNKNIHDDDDDEHNVNVIESNRIDHHHHSVGCIYHQNHNHHKNQHSKSLNCVIHSGDDQHHFNDHHCFIKKLVHKNYIKKRPINNNSTTTTTDNNTTTIINDNHNSSDDDIVDCLLKPSLFENCTIFDFDQNFTTIINESDNKQYHDDDDDKNVNNDNRLLSSSLFLAQNNDNPDPNKQSLLPFLRKHQKSLSSSSTSSSDSSNKLNSSISDFYPNLNDKEKFELPLKNRTDKNSETKEKIKILKNTDTCCCCPQKFINHPSSSLDPNNPLDSIFNNSDNKRQSIQQQQQQQDNEKQQQNLSNNFQLERQQYIDDREIETKTNPIHRSSNELNEFTTSVVLQQNDHRFTNNNNNNNNDDDDDDDNCQATTYIDKIRLNNNINNSNVTINKFHKSSVSNNINKIGDHDGRYGIKISNLTNTQVKTNLYNQHQHHHPGCQLKRRPRRQQQQSLVNCCRHRKQRYQDRHLLWLQQSTPSSSSSSSSSTSCVLYNNSANNFVGGGRCCLKSSDISKFQTPSSLNLNYHSTKRQFRQQQQQQKQGTNKTNDCLIFKIDENQQRFLEQQQQQQQKHLLKIDRQFCSDSSKKLNEYRKIFDTTFKTGSNQTINENLVHGKMHQKKGILIISANKKQSGIKMDNDMNRNNNNNNVKKLVPKKRVAFVELDPEIIGFRCPTDDEDDDQDLLDFVHHQNRYGKSSILNENNDNHNEIIDDDNDDDSSESDDLELKKITAANTLFNSNYGNFKCFSDGVLGRNKTSTNDGPVKFKISDSYQQPLPETVIINKQTNSIRQMFEKNQKNTTNDGDLMTNGSKPPPSSMANINQQNGNNNNNKENEKRLAVNFVDVSENINHQNISATSTGSTTITTTTINNKDNGNQNVPKIPKVKLQLSNIGNNVQLSTITNGTLLEKKIKEIDIDRIRIPRASIQTTTKTVPTTIVTVKQQNNEDDISDNLKSDIKCENHQHDNNNDDDDHKSEIAVNGSDSSSVILVDNREGSILTLDSKNLSQIDHHTTTNGSELFYLPPVSCTGKKSDNNKSSDNNHNHHHHNLDTLSQSSSSSGCCSVTNSSSSSTMASSSSSSSSHSTSPTNIETCSSSSSSSPDSLESAPDSYDSSTKFLSDGNDDEILETVKEEEDFNNNNNNGKAFQIKNNSSKHHDNGSSEQQQAAQKVENQPITMAFITNHSSSNRPEIFDHLHNQGNNNNLHFIQHQQQQFEDENENIDGPDENYVVFQPNRLSTCIKTKESICNVETIQQQSKELKSRHTSTIVINSNGSSEITTTSSILTNGSLKHSDSLSSEDKRSQMLAKMALDLKLHRNDHDNHRDSSSTPTDNLSRSDSNQSSVISSKTNESFRERLIREAYETNSIDDANDSVDNHRGEIVFGKSINNNNKIKKGSISSDDSSDDDCNVDDDNSDDDDENVNHSDSSDISDHDDTDDNSVNNNDSDSNEKFTNSSNPTAKKSISKLFKNVVTFNANNKKKYKKIVQKNLRKTSKFISETTQQIRMDTTDMVRRLKNDKKSTTSEKDGFYSTLEQKVRHGKWNLMGSSSPSKHQTGFNGSSTETLDEEPTLVKIKRLESTKYIKPPTLLQSKKFNLTLNNIKEENGETLPPSPPNNFNDINDSQPPKPPVRRTKAINRTVGISAEKTIEYLEQKMNVIIEDVDNLDDCVDIIEDFRVSLKDCRFYRINLNSLNIEAHLLTSKTFWVTCYDSNLRQHHYDSQPCLVLEKKWSDFLTITTFCDRLNRSFTKDNRQMLVDSIVLQLYCILARFEMGTTRHDHHQQQTTDNQSKHRNHPPLTVGDMNDALVGISVNDNQEIVDVLLLLPSKTIEVDDNDEKGSLELDSLSMMQAFCLQVFLMRLTRLISSNQSEENRKQSNRSSHYNNVSKRLQTFTTLSELKILSAIDIFHIVDYNEKDPSMIGQQIRSWINDHRQPQELKRRYISVNNNENSNISILDYLELDFVVNTKTQNVSDLVYKDHLEQ